MTEISAGRWPRIDLDAVRAAPVEERRAVLVALNWSNNTSIPLGDRDEWNRAAWRLLLPYWQDETRH
jgi:hypothetical protein